jgi:alpha-L-fucosidase
LIDVVSKNGNLLLNIGPRADGTIPDEVQQVLREVGSWLKVNGDAVYGTRPWKVYGEGPTQVAEGSFHDTDTRPYTPEDFRFTTKGDVLYAIELGWPSQPEALIHTIKTTVAGERPVESVELLGLEGKLQFKQQKEGLHIQLPAQDPGRFAYAFKIRFVGGK